ncbi:MAG: class I SAM-dependent methyltransferase [Planctomycetota bacterium]
MRCRHCAAEVTLPLVDLGSSPPSNAYLARESLDRPERWFPLRVLVCERCWLAQTQDFTGAGELFDRDYAYFSGFSSTWLAHAERYVSRMAVELGLGSGSHVVEVASNDGYLLQYVKARGVPCTGIEPTASTAAAARAKGIPVVEEFFGTALARRLAGELPPADLMAANNVLAHVPDINDFLGGFTAMLAPAGVATFEFPHLLRLLQEAQFDTIYHEHFSYLSLGAVRRIAEAAGLSVFDVEELPTHGGSLRVFAQRTDTGRRPVSAYVAGVLGAERAVGMESRQAYEGFQARAEGVRDALLRFLLDARRDGRRVAAYGAAAKGNTLLNFAGVRPHLLPMVADRNPAKQGRFMPGSRIPIVPPEELDRFRPDDLLVLPWNLADEVRRDNAHLAARGTRFVTAVPELRFS